MSNATTECIVSDIISWRACVMWGGGGRAMLVMGDEFLHSCKFGKGFCAKKLTFVVDKRYQDTAF